MLCALLCCAPATLLLGAQSGNGGASEDVLVGRAPLVLRLPTSARVLAMGDAGVASADADALFYNPAMVSVARGAVASVQRYGGGATSGAVANVTSLGRLAIGVGARVLDWSTPAQSYGEAISPGGGALGVSGATAVSSLGVTAGAAYPAGPLRIGAGVTYLRESFGASFDQTTVADVGAVMPMGPMNLALSLQHLGAPVTINGERLDMPWRAGLGFGGAGYPLSNWFDLGALVQLVVEAGGFVRPAGGLELSYVPIEGVAIVGRVGSRSTRLQNEASWTSGLGVTLDRLSLDYALEPFPNGAWAHRVGVRVR